MLLIALLYACEKVDRDVPIKDDTSIDAELPDNGEADFKLPEVIFASISENDGQDEEGQSEDNPQTRTYVGEDGHTIYWHHGDDVSFFAAKTHNVRYSYEGADGVDVVELVKDDDVSGVSGNMINKSLAIYPYNENIKVVYEDGLDKIKLNYPTTQKYGVNSFGKDANIMVAAGQHSQDYGFHFRNAGGYLVIKLYSKGTSGSALHIKDITLSALNGKDKISGSAVIVASKYNAPEITMAEDASVYVTLDCSNDGAGVALGADADHATEFWFCLPPVTFNNGMNITITDVYGNTYTKQTRKTIDIVRNEVQPMSALEIVSQAPTATKLWYTRSDNKTTPVEFYDGMKNPFNAQIIKHEWDSDKDMMVIEFAGPLTTIQAYAFRDTEIATIVLDEGITTIEKEAFRNTPLKEITIPGSITTIGVDAFYDCDKLASVSLLPSSTKTPLKIDHTISTFGAEYGAFFYTKLTTVNLDRELVYIDKNGQNFTPDEWDEGMFVHEYYDEVNSVNVTLGPQVESLMNYMFNYLPIQNITIPGTLKRIGNCVFDGCTALRTLTYESSPTAEPLSHGYNDDSYDEGPFIDSPLTEVTLNREILYTYPVDYLDEASEGLFGDKPTLTSLTLGSDVRILSGYMFANSGITSIDLNNVTHIHNGALMGTRITEISLPASVTHLGDYAFADSALESIDLNQVISIGKGTLRGARFKSITIPASVTSIGDYAFQNCRSLASLTFASGSSDLTIGFQPGTAEYGPFYQSPLTEIIVNRSLVLSKSYADACDSSNEGIFSTEHNMLNTSISLGGQVGKIPEFMFGSLPITSITIPATVTEISNDAFTDCNKLRSITFESSATPLTVGYNTAGDDEGLFAESPLISVVLDREINYTFPDPDDPTEGLFGGKPALTDITIGDNVKTLSGYMFADAGVTSFNLNKVTTIGNGALMGIKFADITIPATVTSIGDYAFKNCTSLTNLTFADGESDLTIGFQPGSAEYGPFYQSPLTEIIVNRSLVLSKSYADACDSSNEGVFSTEHNMQSATISLGGQVGKIPEFMFGCLPLTSITIPATVTEISNDAFTDCVNLTSVTFEEGATPITIGYNTAGDDDGLFVESPLEKVVLNREVIYTFPDPDTPTEGLFGGKPALTDITIGDNVKTLSGYMFADAGVTSFNLNKVTTIGNGALMGIKFADITIPATVTSIGDYAFKNCTSLTNLTFADGESDLTIGFQPGSAEYGPFYQSPLTEIIVNRSLVLSKSYADACDSSNEGVFSTEHNMQSATISLGGQVGKIPEFMFGCLPLTSITIPATVTEISNDAFTDCVNLTSVTFEEGATPITIGYNTAGDDDGLFVESPLEKVVLNREVIYTFPDPDTPTEGLFGGKSSLTSVTLGANVRTVSDYMFAGSGITSIDLKQVTSIGKGAFSGTKLNSIIIPSEVNKIGINAFVDCDDIAEVEIQDGSSILTVGDQDAGGADWGPFYDSPLKKIILGREINYVDGNSNTFTPVEASDGFFANEESGNITDVEITISNNVRTISNYMFSDLKMNSLTMPSSVTKIGNYAFNGCSTLTDLNIPEKVTEIADGTFYGCSSLTSLIIPANVTRIGDNAFYNCSSISDLTIDSSTTPLTFGYQPSDVDDHGPFYQSPLRSIKLDRPIEMTEEYKTYCDQWDEGIFSNNSYNADGDWVTDLVLGPNVKTILKYMFAGTRVQQLHIPETVDEIGVNVVENNKKLNAIIFYDTKVRPDVEHGAFGLNSTGLEMDWENLDPSIEAYPPGKYQYYVFVPLRKGRNFNTLYHSDEELKKYTYWDDLHAIMVDDMPGRYGYYQSHEVDKRHHESRYLDVPGYEWYRKRYYDEENITPPIF